MTDTVSFGYEDVAPTEKTARVGGVFTSVAANYDLMNDAMSGGMHRLWKDRFVRRVKPRAGEQILDMAGGTGDIAFRLAEVGRERHGRRHQPGDARSRHGARAEARHRRPGLDRGECRDADLPRPLLRRLYDRVRHPERHRHPRRAARGAPRAAARRPLLLPRILDDAVAGVRARSTTPIRTSWCRKLGKLLAGDEDSYRYLIESIRRFPDMPTFEGMIGDAGFVQTKVEPMLGGLVAIHRGWKI